LSFFDAFFNIDVTTPKIFEPVFNWTGNEIKFLIF
jgi:hypothetical protein